MLCEFEAFLWFKLSVYLRRALRWIIYVLKYVAHIIHYFLKQLLLVWDPPGGTGGDQ